MTTIANTHKTSMTAEIKKYIALSPHTPALEFRKFSCAIVHLTAGKVPVLCVLLSERESLVIIRLTAAQMPATPVPACKACTWFVERLAANYSNIPN